MKFDDILVHIGELGVSQFGLYILYGLFNLIAAWQNMGVTFFGGPMDHWCLVPELQHLPYDLQKKIAIPMDEKREGEYSQCKMLALEYSNRTWADWAAWNRSQHVSANTTVVPCDAWVYDQSVFESTIISQFGLVCDREYLLPLVQTVYMIGFLLGCIGFGQMSDSVGRKPTMIVTLTLQVVCGVIGIYIPNYYAYLFFRLIMGATVAGSKTTVFVIAMEIVGPRHRMRAGVLVQAFFAAGLMSFPGLAFCIRDHYRLQLVCALSPIVMWAIFIISPESPRWLVAEGKDEEATRVLQKMATLNGKQLPDNLNLAENRQYMDEKTHVQKATLKHLCLTPNLRLVSSVMWFVWFATSMGFYGISLGVTILEGSIFLNTFLMGCVEMVGFVTTSFILDITGRRWPTCFALIASGAACFIGIAFVDKPEYSAALTTSLLIGKFFVSANFSIIYVYSAEVFPTVVRNVGVGSSSMLARVGGFLQPQVGRLVSEMNAIMPSGEQNVVSQSVPFMVYGATMILSGMSAVLLPETLRRRLPETIEEGEVFAKRSGLTCCPKPEAGLRDNVKEGVISNGQADKTKYGRKQDINDTNYMNTHM